jgi:uncharacterized protein
MTLIAAPLLPVLVASLLGSAHCAAMCGGFVCLYAGESRAPWTHVAYNGGRLLSYLVVGALAGAAGAGVQQAGVLIGVGRAAAIVSGVLLLLLGTALLLRAVGVRLPVREVHLGQRMLAPLLHATRDASPTARAGTIGVLTALLPCGWLYAFAVTAAGTGRLTSAMLTMAVFWLGTLPAMATVGIGLQRLTGPLRLRLPLITAVAVMLIGVLSITGRLSAVADPSHGTAADVRSAHR